MAGKNGGARPGAGRKPGKVGAAKRALAQLAGQYAEAALETLAQISRSGESESARVSAAVALLDRAYGRPAQAVQIGGDPNNPLEVVTRIERVIIGDEEEGQDSSDRDAACLPTAH